ncbi:ankyrin repeat domain-containing protein [Methylibium petroleiphilum]|uniref:Ankyrin repeat protein n=1 Tax=Methylibium petroleiphilum (strain ATCC BAA-1232 / LMG 22953 / PM1) TaxID=420662 RepID=A2SML4_METPP|nr:ankyrin repeat domain-containing protein [Methylibium petroleiphilum]ABM96803.1 hypothetical protein Mpe_B0022 [Methylibium petroleiphilum PM1]
MSNFADTLRSTFARWSTDKELRSALVLLPDLEPTCRNSEGETPLMVAIAVDNRVAVEILVEKGHPVTDEAYEYAMRCFPSMKHVIAGLL